MQVDRRDFCLAISALLVAPQVGLGARPESSDDRLSLAIGNLASSLRAQIGSEELARVAEQVALLSGSSTLAECQEMYRHRDGRFLARINESIRCDFQANRCIKLRDITMSRTEVGLIVLLDSKVGEVTNFPEKS